MVQFLLAGQNDLHQLAAAVLEIAEQADFFENVPIEIVRLVDDQYGGAAGGGALDAADG